MFKQIRGFWSENWQCIRYQIHNCHFSRLLLLLLLHRDGFFLLRLLLLHLLLLSVYCSINHFLPAECHSLLLALNKHCHPCAEITFHITTVVCMYMCGCLLFTYKRTVHVRLRVCLCTCTFSPAFYSTVLYLISLRQGRQSLLSSPFLSFCLSLSLQLYPSFVFISVIASMSPWPWAISCTVSHTHTHTQTFLDDHFSYFLPISRSLSVSLFYLILLWEAALSRAITPPLSCLPVE